jgi:hypothetical protein
VETPPKIPKDRMSGFKFGPLIKPTIWTVDSDDTGLSSPGDLKGKGGTLASLFPESQKPRKHLAD